ncbi:MAG: hypothetical protein ACLU3F_07020 [Blautia wexlerae]
MNDFIKCATYKEITVYGTIDGTDDPSSPAYGFTGKTAKAVYTITPLAITKDNLKSIFSNRTSLAILALYRVLLARVMLGT